MLRIRPQYQDIAPSTAHHISHKSVPKSRFVPASPQGEAFASAVHQLAKSQFIFHSAQKSAAANRGTFILERKLANDEEGQLVLIVALVSGVAPVILGR